MGKISNYMLKIAADDSHGYDQKNRNGDPDFDCSSLVIAACKAAGFNTGSASYTGNMLSNLKKAGFTDVTKSVNLKTGEGLKVDDILLTPGKHTAVYTGSGQITDARIAENGKAIAGKKGDQTGHEIETHAYKDHPWTYVLRPPVKDTEPSGASGDVHSIALEVLRGKYGSGDARKKALGKKYLAIQAEVNRILRLHAHGSKPSLAELAAGVMRGEYGNGEERKKALGERYNDVQKYLNDLIKGGFAE